MDYPGTKILPCTCEHEDQDKMYGRGMRVHNRVDGGKAAKIPVGYACTVCTPRAVSCEKNTVAIEPAPHLGLKFRIPAKQTRRLKPLNAI